MQIPFKVFLDTQNILSGYETPQLHQDIADWIEKTQHEPRRILQVFRHAGKSYILCCYVAWRLLCDPNYTCIIISAKQNLALRNSMMIRSIIETNPLTAHLKSELEQWQAKSFTIEREHIQLNPSVTVSSLQSSFTGMHSEEIIGDDIEVSQNVLTEDARDFIRDRVQEFGKISKRIFLTGTPHHEDTIYAHCKNIGYEHELKIPVYDSTGKLSWPDHHDGMFTWDWIERQRRESTEGDFKSQFLLIPSKTYEALMDMDKVQMYNQELTLQYLPQPMGTYLPIMRIGDKRITRLCAAWDPATGLKGRDASVLAICGRDEEGYVYVHDVIELDAAVKKDFQRQCEQIIDVCSKYHIGHVFVEENFSPTLQNELRRTALDKKKKVVVMPVFRQKNKLAFMAQQLEPVVKVGRMRVHEQVKDNSHFLSQLQEFPYTRHDDCIDAVAEAINHLPEPMTDVSKIPSIQSPLGSGGGKIARLTS